MHQRKESNDEGSLNVLVFVLTLQFWACVRVWYVISCRSSPMTGILVRALFEVRAPAGKERRRENGEQNARYAVRCTGRSVSIMEGRLRVGRVAQSA
jgi:hypothetical protein